MALIAHYPLLGNVNDYTANRNHGVNYGATVSNSGKIGKCYSFSSNRIETPNQLKDGQPFSVAFWGKIDTRSGSHCFCCTRTAVGNGFSVFVLSGALRFDTGAGFLWSSGYSVPADQWVHYVVSMGTEKKQVYINGELFASTADVGTMTPLSNIFGIGFSHSDGASYGNYLAGSMNDVRIYDHVLSQKEIKEISRAKILHYTFDDFQEPTENILIGGDIPITSSSYGIKDYTFSKPMIEGETYTISLKGTLGEGKSYFGIYNSGGSVRFVSLYPSDMDADGVYRKTFTGKVGTSANTYARVYHMPSSTVTDSTVEWIQIENKDHATPFTPGTRGGIVRDISGFGSDATMALSTTPQWTSDSKIGSGAYLFSGQSNRISVGYSDVFNIREAITLSIWIKRTTDYNQTADTLLLSRNSAWYFYDSYNSGNIRGDIYIEGVRRGAATTSVPFDGNWYNVVYTYDSATRYAKMYKNGILVSSTQLSGLSSYLIDSSASPLSAIGNNTLGRGMILDDARIYATALSAEDILELYQTRGSLDSSGHMYVGQVVENIEPTTNIYLKPLEPTSWGKGSRDTNYGFVSEGYGEYFGVPGYTRTCSGTDYRGILFTIPWDTPTDMSIPITSSIYVRCLNPSSATRVYMNFEGKDADGVRKDAGLQVYVPTSDWTRISCAETLSTKGFVSVLTYMKLYFYGDATPRTWQVAMPQAEQKDHVTPFTVGRRGESDIVPANFTYGKHSLLSTGTLGVQSIYEIGMPIRYIRDYVNGSTSNTGCHWVEIMAIDEGGTNAALNKPATSPIITDGNTAYSSYYEPGISTTGGRYVEVDLESTHIITELRVWHYWSGGRTYYNTKTEVSSNGIDWVRVFDSAIEGEYPETSEGHLIILKPNKMSIDKNGNLFTPEIREN